MCITEQCYYKLLKEKSSDNLGKFQSFVFFLQISIKKAKIQSMIDFENIHLNNTYLFR